MVPGYEAKAPITAKFIVDNVPPEAWDKIQKCWKK
jgi:hypothetical protein